MNCNYEVIRLIQQNSGGHIIMDCVEGEILGEYLLRCPKVEKRVLFQWIAQLLEQLKCIERIQGCIDYRYLTPFYIVLKSDQSISLLNFKAKLNQKCVHRVSMYPILRQFYPQNGAYSDTYAFGKTLQFLLAKAEVYPSLTLKETYKLQTIISKCLNPISKIKQICFADLFFDISVNKKSPIKGRKPGNRVCDSWHVL